MAKYRVKINYAITGYLRYGHSEEVVEAESEEKALEIVDNGGDFVIDSYRVEDYEEIDHEVEKVED